MKKGQLILPLALAFLLGACDGGNLPIDDSSDVGGSGVTASSETSETSASSETSSSSEVDPVTLATPASILADMLPEGGLAFRGTSTSFYDYVGTENDSTIVTGMDGYLAEGEFYNAEEGMETIHYFEDEEGYCIGYYLDIHNQVLSRRYVTQEMVSWGVYEDVPIPFAPFENPFAEIEAASIELVNGEWVLDVDEDFALHFGSAFTGYTDVPVEALHFGIGNDGHVSEITFDIEAITGNDYYGNPVTIEMDLEISIVDKDVLGIKYVEALPLTEEHADMAAFLESMKAGNFTTSYSHQRSSGQSESVDMILTESFYKAVSPTVSGENTVIYYADSASTICRVTPDDTGEGFHALEAPIDGTIGGLFGFDYSISPAFFTPLEDGVYGLTEEGLGFAAYWYPFAFYDDNLEYLHPDDFRIVLKEGGADMSYDYSAISVTGVPFTGTVEVSISNVGTTADPFDKELFTEWTPPANWDSAGLTWFLEEHLGTDPENLPYPSSMIGVTDVDYYLGSFYKWLVLTFDPNLEAEDVMAAYGELLLEAGWLDAGLNNFKEQTYHWMLSETSAVSISVILGGDGNIQIWFYGTVTVYPDNAFKSFLRETLVENANSHNVAALSLTYYSGYGTSSQTEILSISADCIFDFSDDSHHQDITFHLPGGTDQNVEYWWIASETGMDAYSTETGTLAPYASSATSMAGLYSWLDMKNLLDYVGENEDGTFAITSSGWDMIVRVFSGNYLDDAMLPEGGEVTFDEANSSFRITSTGVTETTIPSSIAGMPLPAEIVGMQATLVATFDLSTSGVGTTTVVDPTL